MILYAVYCLALMEACLVTAQDVRRVLEPSRADKNHDVLTNEVDDEPKFSSAYQSSPGKTAKTLHAVPVGKENQLNAYEIENVRKGLKRVTDLLKEIADREAKANSEPHLFLSIPLSVKGVREVKEILDVALFRTLEHMSDGSEDSKYLTEYLLHSQTGSRGNREAPTNFKESTTKTPDRKLEQPAITKQKFMENLLTLQQILDDYTDDANENSGTLEDFFLAPIFQNIAPSMLKNLGPLKDLPAPNFDDLKFFYDNFLLNTKPRPVSFQETHEGNGIFRHDPTGIFFGTIWAKASIPAQLKLKGDLKDLQGEYEDMLEASKSTPLSKDLLKPLDKFLKNPGVGDLSSLNLDLLRFIESKLKVYNLKLKKWRSGYGSESKGEL